MEERIFSWSLDGFGSILTRTTGSGRERFVNRYSAMDSDDNDHAGICFCEVEYNSFEVFWGEFTDQPLWLHYCPIFVHCDYKPFLRDFFDTIPQGSLTMGEQFRYILWLHKIEN